MKPMATACHSGSHGSGLSRSSRRITRHRIRRIGNVNVASATVSTRRRGSTARRPTRRSSDLVPRTAHAKNATVTARPRIQAQREGEGEADARLGAGLEGEGNEVADFVDERAELVARRPLRRCAQLLRSLERAVAAIQQGAHVHGGGRRGSRKGGAGSRGGGRALDAGDELCERRRADPCFRQALVRSEEHTSELQSRRELVCRLLLEKKKAIAGPRGGRGCRSHALRRLPGSSLALSKRRAARRAASARAVKGCLCALLAVGCSRHVRP